MSNPADRYQPRTAFGNFLSPKDSRLLRPLTCGENTEATSSDVIRSMLLLMEGRRLAFQQGFPPVQILRQSAFRSISAIFSSDELKCHISSVTARIIYLLDLLRGDNRRGSAAVIEDLIHSLLPACGFLGLDAMVAALNAYGPEAKAFGDYAEELIFEAAKNSLAELLREQLIMDLREHPLGHCLPGSEEASATDEPARGSTYQSYLGKIFSAECFRRAEMPPFLGAASGPPSDTVTRSSPQRPKGTT